MARLLDLYREKVVPTLVSEFKYRNKMQVPKIEKIVASMGVGAAAREKNHLEGALNDLRQITGQKPLTCKARKSVSNFKLREGMEIGVKVTLRGSRMYEFLDRLVSVAIPRVRDFRGLNPDSFDGRGNYSLGIAEHTIFPEVDPDKAGPHQGLNVTIVTTAKRDEEARHMLRLFGMPFRS